MKALICSSLGPAEKVGGAFSYASLHCPKKAPQPEGTGGEAIAQGRPWSSTFALLICSEWPIE